MRNLHLYILACVLTLVGIGLCLYKVQELGLPLKPQTNTTVWTVQARVQFQGTGAPAKVRLHVPDDSPGFIRLDEDFISSNYGLNIEPFGRYRAVDWAVRRARGDQVLYYRSSVAANPLGAEGPQGKGALAPPKPDYDPADAAAIEAILEEVRRESADIESYTSELLTRLNKANPDENVQVLRNRARTPRAWVEQVVKVLEGARIPNRIFYGIRLNDDINEAELIPWLQVHNEQRWSSFDPATGKRGWPENFLVWQQGSEKLLKIEGGIKPELTFSVARTTREVVEIAHQRADAAGSQLMAFSPFTLPLQTQNVYKILLTVPLGALLVVVLRGLIGIRTFGTFMPILMALAFRETTLGWGIVLFSTLVGIGLLMRFYLERLRLLLVPRLAAVLTMVVLLMLAVSVISSRFGAEQVLSIALFPMVILAMTIERMSIIWEEKGPGDALVEGAGSLLVAAAGYLLMTNEYVVHLLWVFPELLLVVLALILLMGSYTGYRLSELWRFRDAAKYWDAK